MSNMKYTTAAVRLGIENYEKSKLKLPYHCPFCQTHISGGAKFIEGREHTKDMNYILYANIFRRLTMAALLQQLQ